MLPMQLTQPVREITQTVTPVNEESHNDTQISADSEVAIININTVDHRTDDTPN